MRLKSDTGSRKFWIQKLDQLVSRQVRERDRYVCQKCGAQHEPNSRGLHCSHYFSRRFMGTRWDLDNLDSFCFGCHRLVEGDKQGWYQGFKKLQLGQKRFDILEYKARAITKFNATELKLLYHDLSGDTDRQGFGT